MNFKRLALITCTSLAFTAPSAVPSAAHAQSTSDAAISEPAANVIGRIAVEGNQRIESRTILTYLGLKVGDQFAGQAVSQSLKDLFATGFFADVKLLKRGDTLVIRVLENPVVSEVVFEGNDHIETSTLEQEVTLNARSIYTKTKLQNDVKRVLDIYRRSGRYTATVEPKIIQRDQNRVDIVYEISEGLIAEIEDVTFIGNNFFSSSELEGVIRSSESRWYQFLTEDDKYDPDRLLFDQELLRRYYTSQGFADFQVKSAHAELSPNRDAFYITFVVDEGAQYDVGEIKFTSQLKDSDDLDLNEFLTIESGETYDSSAIDGIIDSLTTAVGNFGYAFVDIRPRLTRNSEARTVDINFEVKPGPRVYVERINIIGNVRTLDEVLRREFRLAEGDPFNAAKLERSEQRLNNLGFFETVTITNETGSAPDKTIITVAVTEKSTGEVNIGAGFSSSDGPLIDLGLSENNLLGRGQRARARVTFANRRQQFEIGFTEPFFLNRELSAGFDLFKTEFDFESESSFDLASQGGRIRLGYKLKEKLSHNIFYSYRDNDVTDVNPNASIFIRNQEGRFRNSTIGHTFTYDDLNNRFEPTSGSFATLTQEFAGLGGDAKHIKHEGRFSYYYPIAKHWTWSVGAFGGHFIGIGEDINISDRFFIGGETIRGFDNSGLGPRDQSTGDALGANSYYAATTELGFPLGLPEDLGILGAVFVDAGSVFGVDDNGPGILDDSGPRVTVGFGLSWKSPFGPIRIDLSQPVVKEDEDVVENFRFSFGTRF